MDMLAGRSAKVLLRHKVALAIFNGCRHLGDFAVLLGPDLLALCCSQSRMADVSTSGGDWCRGAKTTAMASQRKSGDVTSMASVAAGAWMALIRKERTRRDPRLMQAPNHQQAAKAVQPVAKAVQPVVKAEVAGRALIDRTPLAKQGLDSLCCSWLIPSGYASIQVTGSVVRCITVYRVDDT